MTTTLFLVRHASHDRLGRVLCGRMAGVSLSGAGRAEAAAVAERLADRPISAVYSSPQGRCRETAAAIAGRLGLAVQDEAGLDEIDFGDWTGRDFGALDGDPAWTRWNEARSANRPPNGESMGDAQARAVASVERLRPQHDGTAVALVSHCDVIKSMLCAWLGLSLDSYGRFDIDPASISAVAVGDWGAKVLSMNQGARP